MSSRSAASLAPVTGVVPGWPGVLGVLGIVAVISLLATGCGWLDRSAGDAAPEAAPDVTTGGSADAEAGDGRSNGDDPPANRGTTPSVATGSSTGPSTGGSTATPAITPGPDGEPIVHRIEVVATHPHDPAAYTQGLEVVDGVLLESTGLRGESTLRLVDPTSGEVLSSVPLADDLFGEGATVVGDEVWQLTWTSEVAILRGLDDLAARRQATYEGEGWGLCAEPDRLVMSNGSSTLTFRDRATFEAIGSVEVRDGEGPVAKLNELECVDGLVWANVFQTTRLLGIEPDSGRVVATVDLDVLVPDGFEGDGTNVANGVAHDTETGRFWLTGKRWPVIYEVELVPES